MLCTRCCSESALSGGILCGSCQNTWDKDYSDGPDDTYTTRAQYLKNIENMRETGVMTFGKYEGKKISSLPTNYLKWMCSDFDKEKRKTEIKEAEAELKRRKIA